MAAVAVKETRDFPLGDVLSVTTGRLVGPGHIQGIQEILEFLTDGPVFTHALPTVSRLVEPALYDQYPWLKNVVVPEGVNSEQTVKDFIAPIAEVRGETIALERVPKEIYEAPETPEELLAEFASIYKRVHRGVTS